MEKLLSASKAGFPCMRNLWYSVNGYKENVSEKSQRIFDVGTALEPVIVEWLKADGWNVEYNPGSQDAEIEVTIPIYGGKLAGHPDCIISKGEIQNALIDIKTMNDRSYTHWKREGTHKAKPQYVTQLHIYAAGLMAQGRKIERLGIVGVNKNNSEMHIDLFDYDSFREQDIKDFTELLFGAYDEGTYLDILSRAEMIANASTGDELDGATEKWACNYCEYANQCKLDQEPFSPPEKPEANTDAEIPVTQDETIIRAMKALQNARELSKQARELEADAKPVLDENVKCKGLRRITGGGLVCTVKENTSSRFDSTAFKKAHPDMVGQFMKSTKSTTYEIKGIRGGEEE